MPLTPQNFVSKWKCVTAHEKQTYQEHFIDLCRLVVNPYKRINLQSDRTCGLLDDRYAL